MQCPNASQQHIQATGKDDHDYANHLYDMEAADDVGNAMGNQLF